MATNYDNPSIYVADLKAYNEGKLIGEWVDLTEFDEGYEVMEKISDLMDGYSKKYHNGMETEYAIHDFENFSRELYSESMGEEDFDIILKTHKISEERDIPAEVLQNVMARYDSASKDIETFIDERYRGQFDTETDFAYDYIDMIGGLENLGKNDIDMYFDYDSFGSDYVTNYIDVVDGHYFDSSYKKGGEIKTHDLKKYMKKGGKLKSFFGKAKEVGGKAYEKGREVAHYTKEKAKEGVHNASKRNALGVLDKMKKDREVTDDEVENIKVTEDVVQDHYNFEPTPFVPKKERGGSLDAQIEDMRANDVPITEVIIQEAVDSKYPRDSKKGVSEFKRLMQKHDKEITYHSRPFTMKDADRMEALLKSENYYAEGGKMLSLQNPIMENFHRNIMGTLSFDMQVKPMRKAQDFIVYPMKTLEEYLHIQSNKKFGYIRLEDGKGILSKGNGNTSWHLRRDMQIGNVIKFELTSSQLEELKYMLKQTGGSKVGSSVVFSDNSGVSMLESGGEVDDRKERFGASGIVEVKPRHASREDVQDLIIYLDNNSWGYDRYDTYESRGNNELDYIGIETTNVSREERGELFDYLNNNSWEYTNLYAKGGWLENSIFDSKEEALADYQQYTYKHRFTKGITAKVIGITNSGVKIRVTEENDWNENKLRKPRKRTFALPIRDFMETYKLKYGDNDTSVEQTPFAKGGLINKEFLSTQTSDYTNRILQSIADYYGTTKSKIQRELYDDDAEMIYEYIGNDRGLRKLVYDQMESFKYRNNYAKGGNVGGKPQRTDLIAYYIDNHTIDREPPRVDTIECSVYVNHEHQLEAEINECLNNRGVYNSKIKGYKIVGKNPHNFSSKEVSKRPMFNQGGNISESDWERYVATQKDGSYNMFDSRAIQFANDLGVADSGDLDKGKWSDMMQNYDEYEEKWGLDYSTDYFAKGGMTKSMEVEEVMQDHFDNGGSVGKNITYSATFDLFDSKGNEIDNPMPTLQFGVSSDVSYGDAKGIAQRTYESGNFFEEGMKAEMTDFWMGEMDAEEQDRKRVQVQVEEEREEFVPRVERSGKWDASYSVLCDELATYEQGGDVKDFSYEEDILPILKESIDDGVDEIDNYENVGDAQGEEVEYKSRSGFIPYTDGGYEKKWFEYISILNGSGTSLPTKVLDDEMERQVGNAYEYAKERFIEDNEELVEEIGEDKVNYSDLYELDMGDKAEELSEMEMDMGDDSIMMSVKAFYYNPSNSRAENNQHTITLIGDVNLEAPYHRIGNMDDYKEITFNFNSKKELEDKMSENMEHIIDWFGGDGYSDSTREMKIRRMSKGGSTYAEGGRIIRKEIHDRGEKIDSIYDLSYTQLLELVHDYNDNFDNEKLAKEISKLQEFEFDAVDYADFNLVVEEYLDKHTNSDEEAQDVLIEAYERTNVKVPNNFKFIEPYAKGGSIKGRNNKSGETFGVVIGSKEFTDDDKDRISLNVRSGYQK